MPQITIDTIVERWKGLERPLFRGKLIDADGCKCAQGDVLSCAGFSDEDLRKMEQDFADTETARVLGISRTHAIWLRTVNDSVGGAPQIVLSNPEELVGSNAPILLAFWKYLDLMTDSVRDSVWDSVRASVWASVRDSVRDSVLASVWDSVRASVRDIVWDSVRDSAAMASAEIISMDRREKEGHAPYFLALYGFDTWDKVRALVPTSEEK